MACGATASAEMPSVLLESGKYQETTAKDLDAAAKIYEQIIAEADANRPYIAEAHYRLGAIYLKKGEKEKAIAELKKVVEQYPDQAAFTATAKVLLAREEKPSNGSVSAKPEIVSTTPEAFAMDVDPNLTEMKVTFDRQMSPGRWSWTGGGDTFPQTTGKISYDATGKTCVMPVQLEPGKVYWVGINSPSHKNFVSMAGVPPDWYIILFATKDADGNPTKIPDDQLQRATQINAGSASGTATGGAVAGAEDPLCVSTTPAAFSTDVDPGLTEISVTFDKEMADQSWSWTRGRGDTFPQTTSKPFYDAVRGTCTLPVKLEPGKVYWVGINHPRYQGFRGSAGAAAKQYIILFATKNSDGNPTPIPDDLVRQAKEINADHPAAAPGGSGPTADELMMEGWKLWSEGKLAEAERKFRASLEKRPNDANALNGLGWAQFNQGKPNDAKQSFLRCVELDPKAAAAFNGLGYITKLEGDTDGAIGYWEKAVAANPSGTASLSGLANAYMELGQPDKAVKYFEMWLKVEPDNEDAHDGLVKANAATP
jgi:tetratricopeptide (TPR) repeat protein